MPQNRNKFSFFHRTANPVLWKNDIAFVGVLA